MATMDIRNHVKQLLRMCGHAFVRTVHERLDEIERQGNDMSVQTASLAETQSALLQASIHVVESLHRVQAVLNEELVRQVYVETNDFESTDPEAGLMSFLYSCLPERKAIVVGAHVGDISECLLRSGYEVYAFESRPPVYEGLVNRFAGGRPGFHSFDFALGSSPSDGTQLLQARTLEDLHRARTIPEDICLVNIDTGALDLEVIRGMGDHRYPVVVAGFRDRETPTLESLVEVMSARGYHWYAVLYRVLGRTQTAYYCNYSRSLPNTCGHVFFFRQYDVFAQAQAWCSAVLPRTYFKPVSAR
jgi:hypothetical protein